MATTITSNKPVAKKNTAVVAAPAKKAALAAPAKPSKPNVGISPQQHAANMTAPHGVTRPNVAKPAVVATAANTAKPIAAKLNAEETAELRTALALVTAQLSEANAKLAKLAARPKKAEEEIRTKAELIGGITIKAGDWRESYVGETIPVNDFSARIEKNELVIDAPADTSASAEAFVSMPRDADPGGRGAIARASGRIALWLQETEQGDYQGLPMYLTQAELATVWGDLQPPSGAQNEAPEARSLTGSGLSSFPDRPLGACGAATGLSRPLTPGALPLPGSHAGKPATGILEPRDRPYQ